MVNDARGEWGMAMRWFNSGERKEVWEEAIEWPIGDIEAAQRIREICRAAADSAERVGGAADRPGINNRKSDFETQQRESARYERAARAAMEIAMKVSDDLLRDAAVRQIVELCMAARDTKTARILFRAIQAASIKQAVLKEHPALEEQ
jgi:hypothetical protein